LAAAAASGGEGHNLRTALCFTESELRQTFALFPTGVAIITSPDVGDGMLGATVSSFNSVSVEPPLILFSIALNAKALVGWRRAQRFAVNILGEDQSDLSTRFARALTDKWNGVQFEYGQASQSPLLYGALGWLECHTFAHYDGGDHLIILGQVIAIGWARRPVRPLVFVGSRYRRVDFEDRISTPADEDTWVHGW
jgi:flavin reductase (DIM6/NTAB) family NADH-FMN oxidoreductase RutF